MISHPSDYSTSTAISSTRTRIKEYLIQIDADPNACYRITEAQLRWAHFQRAEKVRETKNRIDRLMRYPENVSDVEGAFSSDGDSTTDDEVVGNDINYVKQIESISMAQSPSFNKLYMGMRPNGQGKWVRRHFSQKRFPHLAKAVPVSPSRKAYESLLHCYGDEQSTLEEVYQINGDKKKKLAISRGRRALLRVSARALEERKKHSLRSSSTPDDVIGEFSPQYLQYSLQTFQRERQGKNGEDKGCHDKIGKKKKTKYKVILENAEDLHSFQPLQSEMKSSFLTLEDEISGLFTTRTGRSSTLDGSTHEKSLRRRRCKTSLSSFMNQEEEERIRRFEEAYRAIMLASDMSHEVDEATVSSEWISSGGKRWIRDPNLCSAVSVDGRKYDDLQRTPTVSIKQMKTSPDCYDVKKGIFHVPLCDKGASWMVHMPRSSHNNSKLGFGRGRVKDRDTNDSRNVLLSPCQKKLYDIEETIQQSATSPKFDLRENRRVIAQSPMRQKTLQPNIRDDDYSCLEVRRQLQINENQNLASTLGREVEIQSASSSVLTQKKRIDKGRESFTPNNADNTKNKQYQSSRVVEMLERKPKHKDVKHVTNGTKKPNVDEIPTVRASTLRLLFSGISNKHDQSKLNQSSLMPKLQMISPQMNANETTRKPEVFGLTPLENSRCSRSRQNCKDSTGRNQRIKSSDASKLSSEALKDDVSKESIFTNDEVFECQKCDESHTGREVISTETVEKDNQVHNLSDQREMHLDDHMYEQKSTCMKKAFQYLDVAVLVRQSLCRRTNHSIIDTDDSVTDINFFDESILTNKTSSLQMTPALITKRYQQALHAIELRQWDQVSYLIKANPWLMEMKDVRNDRCLAHALALFGGGEDFDGQAAPKTLVVEIIDYDSSVAHKLDYEGNLPLHLASASSNVTMIRELGMRFTRAASVQNHDGLLPLHLAIMSCALFHTGEQAVEVILSLFPRGVCILDNDGNTPLHVAAGCLKGDVGVDIIYQLMTVCNDLVRNDAIFVKERLNWNSKKSKLFDDALSMLTTTTDPFTDASEIEDPHSVAVFCLTKNEKGDTPLAKAIKTSAGCQVVEALLSLNGGCLAVLENNHGLQNALHLALESDFYDPSVVLSILKAVPSAASILDGTGTLPIQLACMNGLQREIILAIAIIDLPIDLGAKEEAIFRSGFGASWWFIVCESDDRYVDVVIEILSLCSQPQKMALCLAIAERNTTNKTAVACATPRCKAALISSLRFLGRFELITPEMKGNLSSQSTELFVAIDYGVKDNVCEIGRKVSLRCYTNKAEYNKEAMHIQQAELGRFFEEMEFLSGAEVESDATLGIRFKHCVATRIPKMSLDRVVAGMPRHHKYRENLNLLGRYFSKITGILLRTAEALAHLHNYGIVHGFVDSRHIGKFGAEWKVTHLIGSVVDGSHVASNRLGLHSPPEVFLSSIEEVILSPTFDVWAFGKLMYEVLVGESMFSSFLKNGENQHIDIISKWSDMHLEVLEKKLFDARIGRAGIDLIVHCLQASKGDRPSSMVLVLQHPFWSGLNAFILQ